MNNGYLILKNYEYEKEKPMNQSEQINELATALSKCQGDMEPAIKDSLNPHYKSRYADLNAVWAACREPLSKHGLSVVQTMDTINEKLVLNTLLLHSSGQWIRSTMPVVTAKNDAQGIGSGLSYARRYSLSAICGISQDDDDGEAAMPKENGKAKEKPKVADLPAISSDEANKIKELADSCDPEYIKKLMGYLGQQGIKTFSEIKLDMYNKILNGMVKNAELFSKG